MKLASLKDGSRDGQLAVVSTDLRSAAFADAIAPTLQRALDDWPFYAPQLQDLADSLNSGQARRAFDFEPAQCMAPLPRAYQWADASAYLNHVELVRRARGAEMPPEFRHSPLMYQGGSDDFIGAHDPVVCADEAYGIDFEAELAVVTGDVPMGATPAQGLEAVRLLMLVNDVSLRNLIPAELAKGFGFFQGKPSSAFSPVAVTPDELGAAWAGGVLRRRLQVHWNGARVGDLDCGADVAFGFGELIAHAAHTRRLRAGTIVGSGTVSNVDSQRGYACIAERRMLETIEQGAPATAFMRFGDRVRIEMFDDQRHSIFGAIDQRVVSVHGVGAGAERVENVETAAPTAVAVHADTHGSTEPTAAANPVDGAATALDANLEIRDSAALDDAPRDTAPLDEARRDTPSGV